MDSDAAMSGVKRKRDGPKFYAVRAGHKPGVYHTWAECLVNIKGYKGASFKSFPSLTEAEAFMNVDMTLPTAGTPGAPNKFYAVAVGMRPGIYLDWPSAQKQITGWTKPKHKSFSTHAEALAWMQQTQAELSGIATPKSPAPTNGTNGTEDASPAKRARASDAFTTINGTPGSEFPHPGTADLPDDAEDGFDHRILLDPDTGKLRWKTQAELQQTRPQARVDASNDTLYIYTDGACRANGQQGAIAGVGVFFGKDDPRNLSEPLPGPRQTNQRAELTAIKRALDITPLNRHAHIFSDSSYAINCVTNWFIAWRRNDWKTSSKKPVENKDIIEEILARIEEREQVGVKTRFEWLKGHANSEGNNEADRLAVDGANDARRRGMRQGGATTQTREDDMSGGVDDDDFNGIEVDAGENGVDQGALVELIKTCVSEVDGLGLSFEEDGSVTFALNAKFKTFREQGTEKAR